MTLYEVGIRRGGVFRHRPAHVEHKTLRLAGSLCGLVLMLGGCSHEGEAGSGSSTMGATASASGGEAGTSGGEGEFQAGAASGVSDEGGTRGSKSGVLRAKQPVAPVSPVRPEALSLAKEGAALARDLDAVNAQKKFERALAIDGQAFPAMYGLGMLSDRRGEDGQALAYYKQALQIQADHAPSVEGAAAIYIRRGSSREAVSFVAPIANRWTGNLALQVVYARTLTKSANYSEAWDVIRRVIRENERYLPAFVAATQLARAEGKTELAQSIMEQAFGISKEDAQLHYLQGTMLREEGRTLEAVASFREAVKLQPDHAAARIALGRMMLEAANYEEALAQFQAAARLAPQLPAVHLSLGECFRSMRQWVKAKEAYDLFVRMSPGSPEVHFNLGLMYMAALADFPGMTALDAMLASQKSFTKYRDLMGPRRLSDDPSNQYLAELERQIERERRRLEREARAGQAEAEASAESKTESSDGENNGE